MEAHAHERERGGRNRQGYIAAAERVGDLR